MVLFRGKCDDSISLMPDVLSSNINEVIKTVLNFSFFFFTKRFRTYKKVPKARKHNQAKAKKRK